MNNKISKEQTISFLKDKKFANPKSKIFLYHGTSIAPEDFQLRDDYEGEDSGAWYSDLPEGYLFLSSSLEEAAAYGQFIIPCELKKYDHKLFNVNGYPSRAFDDDFGISYNNKTNHNFWGKYDDSGKTSLLIKGMGRVTVITPTYNVIARTDLAIEMYGSKDSLKIENYVKKQVKTMIKEQVSYTTVSKEEFEDSLSSLATLDLEDDQVIYPKISGHDQEILFAGDEYNLYILNRTEMPSSGAFLLIIESNDEQYIGYLRGTKKDNVISFNMFHIQEEYRGRGIGGDIYRKLLNQGYIIKSDSEITDSTYNLYTGLQSSGYTPLIFSDGTVGLKK